MYAADKAPALTTPGPAIPPPTIITASFAEKSFVNLSNIDQIMSAGYGAQGAYTDVTSIIIQGYLTPQGTLNFEVNNTNIGMDPVPNAIKTLNLSYTLRPVAMTTDDMTMGPPGGGDQSAPPPRESSVQHSPSKSTTQPPVKGATPVAAAVVATSPTLSLSIPQKVGTYVNLKYVDKIVSAQYGANKTFTDVTTVVRKFLTANGTLCFELSIGNMGGDPCPNVEKTLNLQYTCLPVSVGELGDQLCGASNEIVNMEINKALISKRLREIEVCTSDFYDRIPPADKAKMPAEFGIPVDAPYPVFAEAFKAKKTAELTKQLKEVDSACIARIGEDPRLMVKRLLADTQAMVDRELAKYPTGNVPVAVVNEYAAAKAEFLLMKDNGMASSARQLINNTEFRNHETGATKPSPQPHPTFLLNSTLYTSSTILYYNHFRHALTINHLSFVSIRCETAHP